MAPGLPEKIAELPQPFLEVVRRCVVKDATERVQRAEELVALINKKPSQAWDAAPRAGEVPVEARTERPSRPAAPISTTDTGSRAKRNFSVEEEEAEVKRKPAEKHERVISGLRIAVIVAAVLLAASLYIFFQNRRLSEAANNIPATKTDTPGVAQGQTTVQKPAATNPAPATHTPAKDSGKTTLPVASGGGATGEATETKPHRNAEAKKEHSSEERGGVPGKYTLVLTTRISRNIVINNVPYSLLEAGKSMKVPLAPGDYLIIGTNPADPTDVFKGRLNVPANWVNKVGGVEIKQ